MSRSNFRRKRANISLMALVIVSLILTLALSQSQRIRLSIKAESISRQSRDLEALMRNGLARVRTETSADEGVLTQGELSLVYRRAQAAEDRLSVVRITARAEDLPIKWAGLWIESPARTILIKSSGRE